MGPRLLTGCLCPTTFDRRAQISHGTVCRAESHLGCKFLEGGIIDCCSCRRPAAEGPFGQLGLSLHLLMAACLRTWLCILQSPDHRHAVMRG